ncbi:MAG: hypothetical protein JXM70_05655 [Pirellulales bacterium]|nr:hypothetical protein [Pirellulales bacterium]
MKLQFNRINTVFGLVALLGIFQFWRSICWAIANYPGGYSLTNNFLSDLGRLTTLSGMDNSQCASVFSRSVVILAVSLIPFFAVMPGVFDSGRWILRVSGILSAIGLIGIGLTPYDRYFFAHHVALGLWIIPMLVTVVTFFVCAQSSGAASRVLSIGTLLVVLAICGYAFAGEHTAYVVFQKALAVIAVVWLCVVFATVSVSTVYAVTSRRLLAEKQARKYIQRIQKGYRRQYRSEQDRSE